MSGTAVRFGILILVTVIVASRCKPRDPADILLSNVNIVDVESGMLVPARDVLIKSNRVIGVVEHDHVRTAVATRVIDGSDKYLIPGLWDMHAHMMRNEWYKWQLPLLRANGITGFREMWGSPQVAQAVRRQMESDSLPYFRFISSGHILDGRKPYWPGSIPVPTTNRAVALVDSLKHAGVNFIKVYSFLDAKVFHALADRCREERIPFAGHVPHTVWITEASAAGMISMEHLYGFLTEGCLMADSAMSLMKQSEQAFERGDKIVRKRIHARYHELVLNHFSPQRIRSIAKLLKRNGTYIVPTLAMLKGYYFINDDDFVNDPRKKYMSSETLTYWDETRENDLKDNSEADWRHKRERWKREQEVMRILIAEEVALLVGTDSDNPYAFPGFSVHDEMASFVELGMTPLDALRAATITAARFLGATDSLGTIGPGKLADMVLLEANPLEDINNTKKIDAVIANGTLFGRQYVDSILGERE